MRNQDIEIAKQVIDTEIEGLKALEKALDDKFVSAVEMIHNCTGKIILSGMGKSGHIATKIAATLASTGTPSIFVHPAEASHGDLGMIGKGDIVILLSNSGETSELSDIIHYCKRFDIKLLSMVRRKTSTLVEASDVAFILPEIPEASPVAAPTTSTTMMLAWGDAIAMAVMNRKGFSKDDFGVFHPGGKLGSQFLKVSAIMAKGDLLPTIDQDALMSEAIIEITKKSLGCVIVIDSHNKVSGIITDGDLRRHMGEDIISKKVSEIAHQNPQTIRGNMLAIEALGIMNRKSITSLIVADEDKQLLGLVHIHHLLASGLAS
jgi:arabinose-5-phosphate isomerase